MSTDSQIQTAVIGQGSADIAEQLNDLLVQLSPESKVDQGRLEQIINSQTAGIIVAKDGEKIVGMATVNVIQKLAEAKAELEDFVVDTDQRGKGVAGVLWDRVIDWCRQKEVGVLEFTSRPSREAAQRFYSKVGAEIRDTNFFRYKIK